MIQWDFDECKNYPISTNCVFVLALWGCGSSVELSSETGWEHLMAVVVHVVSVWILDVIGCIIVWQVRHGGSYLFDLELMVYGFWMRFCFGLSLLDLFVLITILIEIQCYNDCWECGPFQHVQTALLLLAWTLQYQPLLFNYVVHRL